MKKYLLLLLALTLIGCEERSDKYKTLRLAVPANEELRPVLMGMIEKFETGHPGVKVQLLEIAGSYYQKVLVMIAGGTPPDLMWMGQSFTEFAVKDVFMDLTDRIKNTPEINLKEYPSQVLGWYNLNGKQLGIPYGIDVGFIAYNKEIFKKRGVPFPDDDWDVDDLLAAAKKLTYDENGDGRVDVYGYSGQVYFAAFGASLLTKDKSAAACDSKEMLDAIHYNLDLVYKWKVSPPPDVEMTQKSDRIAVFHQGKLAMRNFETYHLPFLREQCVDIDWDIALIPKAKRKAYWASSSAYLISKDTKHPDEAWLFLREFISDDFQKAMASGTIPANQRVARMVFEGNTRSPKHLKVLLKAVDHLYPFPRVPNLQELMHAFSLDLSKIYSFYDKPGMCVTPKKAMERAAKRINKIIKRNKKRLR